MIIMMIEKSTERDIGKNQFYRDYKADRVYLYKLLLRGN